MCSTFNVIFTSDLADSKKIIEFRLLSQPATVHRWLIPSQCKYPFITKPDAQVHYCCVLITAVQPGMMREHWALFQNGPSLSRIFSQEKHDRNRSFSNHQDPRMHLYFCTATVFTTQHISVISVSLLWETSDIMGTMLDRGGCLGLQCFCVCVCVCVCLGTSCFYLFLN